MSVFRRLSRKLTRASLKDDSTATVAQGPYIQNTSLSAQWQHEQYDDDQRKGFTRRRSGIFGIGQSHYPKQQKRTATVANGYSISAIEELVDEPVSQNTTFYNADYAPSTIRKSYTDPFPYSQSNQRNIAADEALAWEIYEAEAQNVIEEQADQTTWVQKHSSEHVTVPTEYSTDEYGWQIYEEPWWDMGTDPSPSLQPQPPSSSYTFNQTHVQAGPSSIPGNLNHPNPFRKGKMPQYEERSLPDLHKGPKDCIVCTEEKSSDQFPPTSPTEACDHSPNTCLDCLKMHIKTTMDSRVFHEEVLTCPECSKPLKHEEVEQYADSVTFQKYMSRAAETVIDQIPNLFRCPALNCGSGQIHDSGEASPIVRCVACRGRFCFIHRMEWHETLSCEEYDRFLANPRGFRSRFDIENEKARLEQETDAKRRREQEDLDEKYVQSLVQAEQREDVRRKAEQERQIRIDKERQERIKREAERKRVEEQRQRLLEEAERKKGEQLNLQTISQTTKNCPNCKWPIEKNDGCAHMTCTRCCHQFCYECLAPHAKVQKIGNTAHMMSCSLHTLNLKG